MTADAPQVHVATPTRFHLFDLARQLHQRGHLHRLSTGDLPWRVDGVPRDRVGSFPWLIGPKALLARAGLRGAAEALDGPAIRTFDRWLARHVGEADVLHVLSRFGRDAHRRAREEADVLTVCDRGSTHIDHQDEVLAAEHDRWGVTYDGIDEAVKERERAEYEECHRVVVPSEFVRETFKERGVPAGKVAKVPYGVDLDAFHPPEDDREDDVFRVLFVGAPSLRKGFPYLLKAYEQIQGPGTELWVRGSPRPEVEDLLAESHADPRLVDSLPRGEMADLYGRASVLVLPSVEEGLALVQAEAMACGVPLVATPNTGAGELFDDGQEGYIVPARDPEALADRLARLRDHPDERDALGEAARARAEDLGGWAAYADRMLDCYRRWTGEEAAEATQGTV